MYVTFGSYVGDGVDTRAITGVGFAPKAVLVKAQANQVDVWRTDTMVGDLSKPHGAAALAANLIQSLDSDGFTLGTDNRVNQNGTTYLWMALGGAGVATLAYTGTGAALPLTGAGFAPDAAIVLPAVVAHSWWHTGLMPAGTAPPFSNAGTAATQRITSLDADGLTIGTSTTVNTNGDAYHVIALEATSGVFAPLAYTGNAVDGRTITGAGFAPDFALTKGNSISVFGFMRFPQHTSTVSNYIGVANNTVTTAITALASDGFVVSSNANANGSAVAYYALTFAESLPMVGTIHDLAGVGELAVTASAPLAVTRSLLGVGELAITAGPSALLRTPLLLAGVAELALTAATPTLFTGAVQELEGVGQLALTGAGALAVTRSLSGAATLEITSATPALDTIIFRALAGVADLALTADPAVMTYGWRAFAGEANLALDGAATLSTVRGLAARIVLGLGLAEVYTGPGSGLTTGLLDPDALRSRLIAALMAGDSLPVHLTQAGLDGLTGRARALSRTSRDELDEPLIEAQFSSRDEARPSAPASGQTPRYQPPTQDNASRQVKRLARQRRG